MERVAECACRRLRVRLDGDPEQVFGCHCDFCLKRTGSAYPVAAWFNRAQVIEISGDSTVYNGLELDGAASAFGLGVSYHFCPTCGSTVYWTFDTIPESVPDEYAEGMARVLVVAAGNFADPDFPPPDAHSSPELRPRWLTTHPDAG